MEKIYVLFEQYYLFSTQYDDPRRAYRNKEEAEAECSRLNESGDKWGCKYYIVTLDLI